jgi:release factor glutamine methyltransferase
VPFHRDIQTLLAPTGEAKALMLLLLEHEVGLTTTQVLMGEADGLSPNVKTALEAKARRVADGEPIQYVLGETQFCGLRIGVEPGVLIPRPETEELVRWAAKQIQEASEQTGEPTALRMLDLCTGSGCIALALKSLFPNAEVLAVDVSEDALRIASSNAKLLGLDVTFLQTDVLQPSAGDETKAFLDLIVSNPPYIPTAEIDTLMDEVRLHDPLMALDGGEDGLDFYRKITEEAEKHLKKGGALFLETGKGQGAAVSRMMRDRGFQKIKIINDLS